MEPDTYPPGSVRALLPTERVTPATRAVFLSRLERRKAVPQFFDEWEFALLRAVCARLIPQRDAASPLDLAGDIDDRLAHGKGDGWRYDVLPPDGEAYRRGLRGLEESARVRHGAGFASLEGLRQDDLLRAVQRGEAPGEVWRTLSGPRFLEELLAEAAECYYSDPLSLEEIGYVGMADGLGWGRIGLDQLEPHEPRAREDLHG